MEKGKRGTWKKNTHNPQIISLCDVYKGEKMKKSFLTILTVYLMLHSFAFAATLIAERSQAGDWRISSIDPLEMSNPNPSPKHIIWVRENGKWDDTPSVASVPFSKSSLIEVKIMMGHIDNAISAEPLVVFYYDFETKEFMIYFDPAFWKNEAFHKTMLSKLKKELNNI